jgi:acyl dehydratase
LRPRSRHDHRLGALSGPGHDRELPALVGRVLGHSAWHTVTQAHVNAFGAATHDMQWIHTDPARAKNGPYGQTIAHGYLTLSPATALIAQTLDVTDADLIVNYGIDRDQLIEQVDVLDQVSVADNVVADPLPALLSQRRGQLRGHRIAAAASARSRVARAGRA